MRRKQSPVWPLLSALCLAAACSEQVKKRPKAEGGAEEPPPDTRPPATPDAAGGRGGAGGSGIDAARAMDAPTVADLRPAGDPRPPDARPPDAARDAGPPPTFTQLYTSIFGRTRTTTVVGCKGSTCHDSAASNSEKISFATQMACYDILTGRGYVDVTNTNPDDSVLIDLLVQGRMPKGGPRMSAADIDRIRAWIAAGAKP